MTGKTKELSESAREGVKRATGKVIYRIHDLIENGDTVEVSGMHYCYIGRSIKKDTAIVQSKGTGAIFHHPYDLLKLIRKNQS